MFAIKNADTGLFIKQIGKVKEHFTKKIDDALQYKRFAHANEVVFWSLDYSKKWLIVNVETGEEFEKKIATYHP